MEQITVGQFGLVYNAFSFTFAAMAAGTLFFWFGRSQVGAAYKTALTITGLVTAIAAYHYFRIFESWTAAYDVKDGRQIWKFSTVAYTGEPGGDTWGALPDGMRAGGDTWIVGSYDPDLDLIYYGVAQPKPWMPASRGTRVADAALYTGSTVALRAEDGSLAWHYQHLPGETLDQDEVFERVLIDNGPEKALFTIGKAGILWKLDRTNGKYLAHHETVFQNVFSSFDAETGKPQYRADVIESKMGDWLEVCPSSAGGKNWHAMSYHPGSSSLVIPLSQSCLRQRATEIEFVEGGGGAAVNRDWFLMPNTDGNVGKLAAGISFKSVGGGMVPCTPMGCLMLLRDALGDLAGGAAADRLDAGDGEDVGRFETGAKESAELGGVACGDFRFRICDLRSGHGAW